MPDGTRITCMVQYMFPGLDLYYVDHAQSRKTPSEELDDLEHDLSDLFVVYKFTLDTLERQAKTCAVRQRRAHNTILFARTVAPSRCW